MNNNPDKTEMTIEKGKELYQKGNYKEAIDCFNEVLKDEQDNEKALFELGKSELMLEDYKNAEKNLKKAALKDNDNKYINVLLGKTLKALGKSEEAVEQFETAISKKYKDEDLFSEIASIYAASGKFIDAVEFIKKAKIEGLSEEEYNKKTDELNLQIIRSIEDRNAHGEYKAALKEIDEARSVIPKEDLRLSNILLSEEEIAQRKTVLDCKVRSLTFTLTNRCNLKCLMCESRKKTWDLPDRTVEEVKRMMPNLERIMWQGGEAFLFERFEELLDEASKYPIRQVIATNGLLMNPEIAEKLVKYNVELTFSIDGVTKESYEHVRPGANFEKVLEKVRLINELRKKHNPEMPTRLNVLIMKSNYKQIEDFLEFAKEYEFTTLFFNSAGCDFRNLSENVFYYNHDPEVLEFIDKIRDNVSRKALEYGIRLENWLPSEDFFNDLTEEKGIEILLFSSSACQSI